MNKFTKAIILAAVSLTLSSGIYAKNGTPGSKQPSEKRCLCTLNVTISPNDTVCTGTCTGTLSATGYGGTPPFTYSWSNGMTTATITGLCAGTYTVTLMDAAACTATASASVTVETAIPSFTITPTITNATCAGTLDGSIFLSTGGPTSPFRFEWGNTYGSNSYNNLNPATYTVTVRDRNNSCNVYTYPVGSNNTCNYITGKIFNDSNFNCTYNAGEPGLNYAYITITPGSYVVYPNSAGNYSQYVPYGSYTVTETMLFGNPFAPCSSSQPVTVAASTPAVNFADTTHFALQDPMITYLYSDAPVIGDTCHSKFQIKNNGTATSTGKSYFVLPDSMSFISTVPAFSLHSHDTLYWNYSGLLPGDTLNYKITCKVDTNPSLFNYNACIAGGVMPNGIESNTQNDQQNWCEPYLVAIDPNSKSVSPPGLGPNGYINLTDSVLTYTIRFENTGTASATNIYVVDTISNYLDINTLQVLGASNAFSYTVTGNRIRFIFSNINLPDSTVNKAGSKGWIQYSIKQKNTNVQGNVIYNTAYIYFDYNAPVITNTTVNTIQVPLLVSEIKKSENLTVYPNPANESITLGYSLMKSSSVRLEVIDYLGRTIVSGVLGTKQAGKQLDKFSVKSLVAGTYVLRLQTANSVVTKKLVIIR